MILNKYDKIRLRIALAKEIALEMHNEGDDLNEILEICIKKEHYCGAEGVRLVIEEKANKKQLKNTELVCQ